MRGWIATRGPSRPAVEFEALRWSDLCFVARKECVQRYFSCTADRVPHRQSHRYSFPHTETPDPESPTFFPECGTDIRREMRSRQSGSAPPKIRPPNDLPQTSPLSAPQTYFPKPAPPNSPLLPPKTPPNNPHLPSQFPNTTSPPSPTQSYVKNWQSTCVKGMSLPMSPPSQVSKNEISFGNLGRRRYWEAIMPSLKKPLRILSLPTPT